MTCSRRNCDNALSLGNFGYGLDSTERNQLAILEKKCNAVTCRRKINNLAVTDIFNSINTVVKIILLILTNDKLAVGCNGKEVGICEVNLIKYLTVL